MKINITIALFALAGYMANAQSGNVGVGTSSPQAKLHVQGDLRVDSLESTMAATQMVVVDTVTKVFALHTFASIHTIGDVKHGFQTGDHDGWVKLDGRSISSLSAAQQAAATSLGFTGNLPNAWDRTLKMKGALASTGGGNTATLSQANLPNVNFTGNTNTTGSHSHTFGRPQGDQNYANGGGNVWWGPSYTKTQTTSSNGDHSHTVTVSSGGSGTPLSVEDLYLGVNVFIYLGNS